MFSSLTSYDDHKISIKLTFFSLVTLALSLFTSTSLLALDHILLFIAFAVLTLKGWPCYNLSKSNMALLGIVGAIFLSAFSVDRSLTLKTIFYSKYFIVGLMAIPLYQILFSQIKFIHLKTIINLFLITLILANLSGMIGLFTGFNPLRFRYAMDMTRSTGMYGMAMTYGYGIALINVILISITFHWSEFKRWFNPYLFWIALITSVLGLYFAYCRGATLGLLCAVPFCLIQKSKKKFLIVLAFCTLLITLWSYQTFVGFNPEQDNINEISQQEIGHTKNRYTLPANAASNLIRIAQYKTAFYAFLEHPFLGLGFRNFEKESARIKKENTVEHTDFVSHTHNNYLEFLAGTGLVGILSFLLFNLFWFIESWKRHDALGVILIPFIIAFNVSGLFQATIIDGENTHLILFIYALSQLHLNNFSKLAYPQNP
ncbi:MAG: O-antigen ligase family protein [Bacteriovoracaceae bacterium]|nr:O-antigen ligase family protein [Bacteriovoracaceae bacterium]